MGEKALATKFWHQLIDSLGPEDPWYTEFTRGESSATTHQTGVSGVKLCYRWRAEEIQATVTIEQLGIERNNNYMHQLKVHEDDIRSRLSKETDDPWEEAEDGVGTRSAARIITRFPHSGIHSREWWGDHIIKLRDTMNEYRDVILPYIKNLKDIEESYYYVIKLHNTSGADPKYKAGFSVNPEGRFKQHVAKFSKHPRSTKWILEPPETVQFSTGVEVRKFEKKLLARKTGIRSKNIERLSYELFERNPLEYARERGWL
jgi:hypothetical protein